MDSYQNLALLENLYRLKTLGYRYIDTIIPNAPALTTSLPGSLESLDATIRHCCLCDLNKSRRQSMCGYGNPQAKVMFVDAFVSAAEDESGEYYIGRSGTMLRDMIEKVLLLPIEDVYVTHAVKCKPFGFQLPSPSECNSCAPYLNRQIDIIRPRVIVTLGADAYSILSGDGESFERVRGETLPYGDAVLIPMHHPLTLIRNPSFKKEALRDLQTIRGYL